MEATDLLEAVATADEMFEALGFVKLNGPNSTVYTMSERRTHTGTGKEEEDVHRVTFDLTEKVWSYTLKTAYYDEYGIFNTWGTKRSKVNVKLTKAVIKKMEELGWLGKEEKHDSTRSV